MQAALGMTADSRAEIESTKVGAISRFTGVSMMFSQANSVSRRGGAKCGLQSQ